MSRPRIFISYRREDSSGHAGRLYDALADHFGSENVFIDVDTIRIGSDFAQTIEQAIGDCDAVVALIGRDWTTAALPNGQHRLDDPGDFVRLELETALAQGISLIPVAVRGAVFPGADELPASLEALARRQGIELRDSAWRDDVNRLIRRLESLSQMPPSESQPARTTRWSRRSKVRMTVATAAIALVAIGIAVAAIDQGGSSPSGQTKQRKHQLNPQLLDAVPASGRPYCKHQSSSPELTATASLECPITNLDVNYYLFPSAARVTSWYFQQRATPNFSPRSGGCRADAFRGEAADGNLQSFCYFANGDANVVWIDKKERIGAYATTFGETGKAAATYLLQQWTDYFK